MGRRFPKLVPAVATAVSLTLAGCALLPAAPSARVDAQGAQAVLDRWASFMAQKPADTIVFTADLTQGGGWSGPNADDAKIAFMSGRFQATVELPSVEPTPTEVVWSDGTRQQVSLISASAALATMIAEQSATCDGCGPPPPPLHVTGAELTMHDVDTARGRASVPVWQFTFAPGDEPIDPISYVAVKDRVGLLDWPGLGDHGRFTEAAYATFADTEITIAFIGGACDDSHSIAAAESDLAIVPIVSTVTRPGPCTAQGVFYGLVLELASPLGNRVVLDAESGYPVPVYPETAPDLRPG